MFKTTRFWLILSLCLNLFFVGLLVGGVSHGRKISKAMPVPQNEITALFRALPKEMRKEFMGRVRSAHPSPKRLDLSALADVIDQEPFDLDALQNYLSQNRSENDKRIQSAQNAVLQSIEGLSDEERDEIAQKLRTMPERKPHKRKP